MLKLSASDDEWLPLGKAAQSLNVHPTTLRRWADNGEIPVLRTPGGHRRFALSDLEQFAEEHTQRKVNGIEEFWANRALAQARAEIDVHRDEKWLANLESEERDKSRTLGRQLMGLTLRFLSHEEESDLLLHEARQFGEAYGLLALEMDLPLADALRAAMFFRDTLVETALDLPENSPVRHGAGVHLLRRINMLLNTVQIAIAEVYDANKPDSLSRP